MINNMKQYYAIYGGGDPEPISIGDFYRAKQNGFIGRWTVFDIHETTSGFQIEFINQEQFFYKTFFKR